MGEYHRRLKLHVSSSQYMWWYLLLLPGRRHPSTESMGEKSETKKQANAKNAVQIQVLC